MYMENMAAQSVFCMDKIEKRATQNMQNERQQQRNNNIVVHQIPYHSIFKQ